MNTNKVSILATILSIVVLSIGLYTFKTNYDALAKDYAALQRSHEELQVDFNAMYKELNKPNVVEAKEVIEPIDYQRGAAALYDIELSEELQQYTYTMCSYYGVEGLYETVLAIMWQESSFVPTKVSKTDDYGLMQINKCNHEYLKENLGLVDMLDEFDNIEGGVYILSTLFEKYEDIDKVLMAYNMGPGGAASAWRRGHYTSAYSLSVREKEQMILQKRKDI